MAIAVLLLFFFSGISGLIYEVLWAKQLILVLGNTALAHTLVLSAFMGGLSLGNAALGGRSDKSKNPLRFYALLELGISFFGFLSPFLLGGLSGAYFTLARIGLPPAILLGCKLLLCTLVLLAPATMMGGTLPALSRFAIRSLSRTEAAVSSLYFVNSAGASLGCLLAGFWLVPAFGLTLPVCAAACLNLAIGASVLVLSRKAGGAQADDAFWRVPERAAPALSAKQLRILSGAVFLSGFAALAYEVAWIRLLCVVLGSSAYSFSLMLSAFIAGIALGSFLVRGTAHPRFDPYVLFGLAEAGIGLTIVLTLPFYDRLPFILYRAARMLQRTGETFYIHQALHLSLCFLLMLLPTTFMGMTLPLAASAAARRVSRIGGQVGRIFSLNSLGNVLGALAAGLFLLPVLGIEGLIYAGILLNLLIACVVLGSSSLRAFKRTAVALAACSAVPAACAFFGPGWNKLVLSAGEFRGRSEYEKLSYKEYKGKFQGQSLLYYKDDSDATITVLKENGDIFLRTNGKTDASALADRNTEILSAHVPLLLQPQAKDVLMVGLGSGITAGSALRHPVEHLDMVEISRGVVEASRFFAEVNNRPLEDSRLSLHIDDAKAFLKRTRRRYDVIISEPSNPWIAGIGNLFSVDFYREAQDRLKPGGLFVQWFHLYEMTDDTFRLILRTFCSQFDHVLLWEIPPSRTDVLLIGSAAPLAPDFARMEAALRRREVSDDIARIGIHRLPTVLSLQLASDPAVRSLAQRGRVNEDQFPILEYEAPKALFLRTVAEAPYSRDERFSRRSREPLQLVSYLKAKGRSLSSEEFRDLAEFQENHGGVMARPFLYEWARRYPGDSRPRWALIQKQAAEGDATGALALLEGLLRRRPQDPAYLDLAAKLELDLYLQRRSYLTEGSPERCLDYLRRLARAAPGAQKAGAYQRIAEIYANTGSLAQAESYIERAAGFAGKVKAGARPDSIWVMGAKMAMDHGAAGTALACLNKALKINPGNPEAKALLQRLPSRTP